MNFDADFLKDRYDYELQRREQLTSALMLPVGVLTALGGAMVAMARSFSYEGRLLTWTFGIFLGLTAIAFVLCLICLARAYHSQRNIYLPLLADIKKSKEEFLEFAKVMARGEGEVLDEFENQFQEHIIFAADRNTQNNDYRSNQLHLARINLFAVLILTALMGIPYVVDQVRY